MLIVDDHPGFRASARTLFESEEFEVVGEAEDGEAAPCASPWSYDQTSCSSTCTCPTSTASRSPSDWGLLDDPPQVVLTSSRADYSAAVGSTGARGFVTKDELSASALEALRLGGPSRARTTRLRWKS